MNHAFPTLYENNHYWKIYIRVDNIGNGFIWSQYGKKGGKEIVSPPRQIEYHVKLAPNKMYDRLYRLAETKWKNKKKMGFSETSSKKNKAIIPMRAHNFTKSSHRISYPAYVQVKYDGYRALSHLGKKIIISRQGKPLHHIDHITKEIKLLGTYPNLYLDGELFLLTGIHQLKSLISSGNSSKNTAQIQYYIFDLLDTDQMNLGFKERWENLQKLFKNHNFKYLKLAETYIVNSKKDVQKYLQKFIMQGHEGLVVRNLKGPYKLKSRSMDVQKLIEVKRGIFKIVGYKESVEKQVVWEIECNKSGRTFWAMPMGTRKYRQELLKNAKKYVGKNVQVKYFEMDKDGCVTRNPVAVMK